MSILIKGMEMPKDCSHCRFQGFGGRMNERILCMLTGTNDYINQQSKFEDCPLIEAPDKHGDLIDRDALIKLVNSSMFPSDMVTTLAVDMAKNWVKDAPTIIPVSEEDNQCTMN